MNMTYVHTSYKRCQQPARALARTKRYVRYGGHHRVTHALAGMAAPLEVHASIGAT